MAGAQERGAAFVPCSFEELKRDTRADRAPLPSPEERITARDLHDLVAERGFMRRSGLVAMGAVAAGALLILIAYARPLLDTIDAFHASGQMAADKAGEQLGGVQGAVGQITGRAAFIKATDEKAIDTARGGLNCLAGKSACPAGSSPLR